MSTIENEFQILGKVTVPSVQDIINEKKDALIV